MPLKSSDSLDNFDNNLLDMKQYYSALISETEKQSSDLDNAQIEVLRYKKMLSNSIKSRKDSIATLGSQKDAENDKISKVRCEKANIEKDLKAMQASHQEKLAKIASENQEKLQTLERKLKIVNFQLNQAKKDRDGVQAEVASVKELISSFTQ